MSSSTGTLVLVPTRVEMDCISTHREFCERFSPQLGGFGPVAAAAVTARILATHQPRRLVLMGIAGSYSEVPGIGSATSFGRVALWGVGAGRESQFQLPSQMGVPQFDQTFEELELVPARPAADYDRLLLTVTSAAGDSSQVDLRRHRFPSAIAEDMEGFGVALAASLFRVPLTIIRGISNRAGVRDKSQWQIDRAVAAAADLVFGSFPD